MCDGDDVTFSRTVQIDTMVLVDKATMSTPKEWWVMVKGHPHLDDDGGDDETAPPPGGDDRE